MKKNLIKTGINKSVTERNGGKSLNISINCRRKKRKGDRLRGKTEKREICFEKKGKKMDDWCGEELQSDSTHS